MAKGTSRRDRVGRNPAPVSRIDEIKRLAIISMFSDDDFLDLFVIKGGSALDLIHRVGARASIDLDLSLQTDFPFSIETASEKIRRALQLTFSEHAYHVFDVKLESVPMTISTDFLEFWGGYQVEFKVIESKKAETLAFNIDQLRLNALMIANRGKFIIDISKFEFCGLKQASDFEGYRIYVYSPEMIVAEKLRAICQQSREYGQIIRRSETRSTPRARDFLDIHTVLTHYSINIADASNAELVKIVFAAKRVPLDLVKVIGEYRGLHASDFPSVVDTVRAPVRLNSFDFYFEYVMAIFKSLEVSWRI